MAYVVCRGIGLAPGTASSDYIQLYQGDAAGLLASLERIRSTASRILRALLTEDRPPTAGPVPDPADDLASDES